LLIRRVRPIGIWRSSGIGFFMGSPFGGHSQISDSEGARNWFFGSHYLPYFLSPDYPNRYRLLNWDGSTGALRGLGVR
jgi:hypothetical protein